MDGIQFISVQGHWGRWAGTVILCSHTVLGIRQDVIPTHRVSKYCKNKSQQVIATNHWRNMLEDKPASTTMSKRQEQQNILTLCPAREDSSASILPPGIWSEEKWLLVLLGVRFVLTQIVLQTLTNYLPQTPSLCQNCRYTAPVEHFEWLKQQFRAVGYNRVRVWIVWDMVGDSFWESWAKFWLWNVTHSYVTKSTWRLVVKWKMKD